MAYSWQIVSDVLILLVAALLLGTLAEQLRQSDILGYLLAGTIVGPHVLGLVGESAEVEVIAELGVALLLFTIGLEFSVRRLRRLGAVALIGGSLQVVVTMLAAAGAAMLIGLVAASGSRPPKGGVMQGPLFIAIPISPRRAARIVYQPNSPVCETFRSATQATPESAESEMARSIASRAAMIPMPLSPSSSAVAPDSRS